MLISIFLCFFHTTFKDLTEQILSKMQQNAPFCVLLKKIPFFHGFIILYLKFRLHRFYIQNAAECTILRPSGKKNFRPPLPILVSQGLACMETGVPGENYRPMPSHWQTLSHYIASSTTRHERVRPHIFSSDTCCRHSDCTATGRYDNVTLSLLLLPAMVTNRSHSTYGSSARSDSHRAVFCPNSIVSGWKNLRGWKINIFR